MANLKLVFSAVRGEFEKAFREITNPIAVAATGAIRDAAQQVKTQGRANIAASGFSSKWQNALRVNTYPARGISINAAALAFHKIPYAGVFETGATINGKPLLWIPISGTPARLGGRRLTPKSFRQQIGPLTLIKSSKGQPILAAPIAGRAGTKITAVKLRRGASVDGARLQPVFVGIPTVKIRKRFDLQAVFNRAANGLGEGYIRNLRA